MKIRRLAARAAEARKGNSAPTYAGYATPPRFACFCSSSAFTPLTPCRFIFAIIIFFLFLPRHYFAALRRRCYAAPPPLPRLLIDYCHATALLSLYLLAFAAAAFHAASLYADTPFSFRF